MSDTYEGYGEILESKDRRIEELEQELEQYRRHVEEKIKPKLLERAEAAEQEIERLREKAWKASVGAEYLVAALDDGNHYAFARAVEEKILRHLRAPSEQPEERR